MSTTTTRATQRVAEQNPDGGYVAAGSGWQRWLPLVLLALFTSAFGCSVTTGSVSSESAREDLLRDKIRHLEEEVASYEEQNEGLRNMLRDLEDNAPYIVVDTENNRLTLRKGEKVLLSAVVGTGSRKYIEEETGRNWYFESPMGSLKVLGKERNPVWIRPDWSFVEENMPVPALDDPDRIVRDVLGKYALVLGNGYKIHGTTYTELLGTHFTHGCISVGDKDLEYLYRHVTVGTKVYIY